MNKQFLPGLILSFVLVGCEDKKPAPAPTPPPAPPAAGTSPLNAPTDYLNTLAKSKNLADKVIDTAALNKAVQLFGAQEGRLPKDLEELVTLKYMPALPAPPTGMKLEYDAKSGEVTVVKP